MRRSSILHLVALVALALAPPLHAQSGAQTEKPDTAGGFAYPYGYLEYLPPGYNTETGVTYPLVIWLHGTGERGNGDSDLNKVDDHGLPWLLNSTQGYDRAAVVLSPQAPSGGNYNYGSLRDFIKQALVDYRCDSRQVYAMGWSMGGGAAFGLAREYPEILAGIAPFAATDPTVSLATVACPVWAFHNFDDSTVQETETFESLGEITGTDPASGYSSGADKFCVWNAMSAAWTWSTVTGVEAPPTGGRVMATIFNDPAYAANHDAWQQPLRSQVFWDWMLTNRLRNIYIKDSSDASGITISGTWSDQTATSQWYGAAYKRAAASTTGSITYEFTVDHAARYQLWEWHPKQGGETRGTVNLDVTYSSWEDPVTTVAATVNQTGSPSIVSWQLVGTYLMLPGAAKVTVKAENYAYVTVADAFKLVEVGPAAGN